MRILIVGSGFVGMGIARQVVADGNTAILCSRHPPWSIGIDALPWTPADATVRGDCVRVLEQVQPDAVVLVHGPSDITWCEAHPDMAMAAHTAATANVAAAACGARIVLVSTDNVFDGDLLRRACHTGPRERVRPSQAASRAGPRGGHW